MHGRSAAQATCAATGSVVVVGRTAMEAANSSSLLILPRRYRER